MSFRRTPSAQRSKISFEKVRGHERFASYQQPPVGSRWFIGYLEREGEQWVVRSRYRTLLSDRYPNVRAAKDAVRKAFA